MGECRICPRKCDKDRILGEKGVCNVSGEGIFIARYSLHMWEEECISGKKGSGTIFFSGCNLRCVYCQNHEISRGEQGIEISIERLKDICLELQNMGANNINLVTPTHYVPEIKEAILMAKREGLILPIVYNTSGYEDVETLKLLDGIVDIYLTDFKYIYEETAKRYSKAEDYPRTVKKALEEMVRQVGEPVFENELMKKGVIVRHLTLPGHIKEGMEIVKYLYDTYKDNLYISLMNQYTIVTDLSDYPEINRRVTKREYQRLVDYAIDIGVENAYIQEGNVAKESFIPDFNTFNG